MQDINTTYQLDITVNRNSSEGKYSAWEYLWRMKVSRQAFDAFLCPLWCIKNVRRRRWVKNIFLVYDYSDQNKDSINHPITGTGPDDIILDIGPYLSEILNYGSFLVLQQALQRKFEQSGIKMKDIFDVSLYYRPKLLCNPKTWKEAKHSNIRNKFCEYVFKNASKWLPTRNIDLEEHIYGTANGTHLRTIASHLRDIRNLWREIGLWEFLSYEGQEYSIDLPHRYL